MEDCTSKSRRDELWAPRTFHLWGLRNSVLMCPDPSFLIHKMWRVNVSHVSPLHVAGRVKFNEILLGVQQSHQESFQQVTAVILDLEGNKIAHIRQNSQVTE